jgi:hypothetical protein
VSAGDLNAWRLRMRNGRYRGVPLGVLLLEHGNVEYLAYLAKRRSKERCGVAARILLRDLCERSGVGETELGLPELGLVEELNAEAAAAGWAEAA